MWVEEHKPQFEAKQFTGGIENVKEMIEFLRNERSVVCTSWVPSMEKPGYIRNDTKEILRIQMSDATVTLDVGEWVIKDPSKPPATRLLFCSAETFPHKYRILMVEEVRSAGPSDSSGGS